MQNHIFNNEILCLFDVSLYRHIFYSPIFIPAQFSFFYYISFCMYVQIFVRSRSTSSLRSLVMKQQKAILDYMKLMTSLKFSAMWAKKGRKVGSVEKKKFDTFAKGTKWLHKSYKFKASYERDLSDYDTNKILTQFSLMWWKWNYRSNISNDHKVIIHNVVTDIAYRSIHMKKKNISYLKSLNYILDSHLFMTLYVCFVYCLM